MRYLLLAAAVLACKGGPKAIQVKEPAGCVFDSLDPQGSMSCHRTMAECEKRLRDEAEDDLEVKGERASARRCVPADKFICVGVLCQSDLGACDRLRSMNEKLEMARSDEPCTVYSFKR